MRLGRAACAAPLPGETWPAKGTMASPLSRGWQWMLGGEQAQLLNDLLVRVFENVVTRVGDPQPLRVRKTTLKLVEEIRREAPVLLAPDQLYGVVGELREDRVLPE